MTAAGQGRLADLVAECLVLRDEGIDDIPYGEICRSAPELEEEVRRSVQVAIGLPSLQAAGPGADQLLGKLLSERYSVMERIGSGAMGVVYGAKDLELGRDVAIKVVHTGLLDRSKALARFEREAAALAAIRHESVVTIYDRGITSEGSPFLVMERIDGVSCSELLEAAETHSADDNSSWLATDWGIENVSEPSYFRQAIQWAASLASGLEAAHAAGVYHRDVKPSNVMITREGRAILLDFGIAAKDDHATLTQTDAAVGTPVYMAPEALLGRTKAQPTQDVYSLAATLYHFLTFQAPYSGSSAEILTALATREPVPAFKVRPGLPRDAQAILDHGLARNPSSRYPSAAAMERDLRSLLAHRPVTVRPTSSFVRVARRVRSSKAFVGAALASVVIFGALGLQSWKAADLNRRLHAHNDSMAHVPANFGVVHSKHRVISDEALRAKVEANLDRLVEAGHEPVVERTLRAAYYLDHGDVGAAVADMKVACFAAGTSYAKELSARYQALPPDASSAMDLQLEDLPSLDGRWDHYLAGFHMLRQMKRQEATALLGAETLISLRHAQELRLLCETPKFARISKEEGPNAVLEFADRFVEQVEELESTTGFRSAMTAHLLGVAFLRSRQDERCLTLATEATFLAPASHVAALNAGIAAYRRSEYGLAEDFLRAGLTLCPGYVSLEQPLAKLLAEQGRAELAREVVRVAGFPTTERGELQRAILGAKVEAALALHLRAADPEGAEAASLAALKYCAMMPEGYRLRTVFENYANAVLNDDDSLLVNSLLKELVDDPLSFSSLSDFVSVFPEEMDAEQAGLAKQWLDAFFHRAVQDARSGRKVDVQLPADYAAWVSSPFTSYPN